MAIVCGTVPCVSNRASGTQRNGVVLAMASPGRDNLASQFMSFVNSSGQSWPLENRLPTPLMPPSTVVKAQMDALMRNDWPEDNSGIKTAFDFSMPYKVEEILQGKLGKASARARAWDASDTYLTYTEFLEFFMNSPYVPMVNCLDWKVVSSVIFHGERRARQAVTVRSSKVHAGQASQEFTFCMNNIFSGAYRNCWMVSGTLLGNQTRE